MRWRCTTSSRSSLERRFCRPGVFCLVSQLEELIPNGGSRIRIGFDLGKNRHSGNVDAALFQVFEQT